MEKFIYNEHVIEYNLERKKIKNCYISVKDSVVTVKVPLKTSESKINELIAKRIDWILNTKEKQKKSAKVPKKYENGEIFKVLSKENVLEISYSNTKKAVCRHFLNKLIVILPNEYKNNEKTKILVKKIIDKFYSELAEKEVDKAMRKIIMNVGIAPNKYKVKNLKSTWGNCSTTANISINKDVAMYSRHAIEYVCLHEICHLKYMNHSKKFWQMVEKYMPDYKDAELELKM